MEVLVFAALAGGFIIGMVTGAGCTILSARRARRELAAADARLEAKWRELELKNARGCRRA